MSRPFLVFSPIYKPKTIGYMAVLETLRSEGFIQIMPTSRTRSDPADPQLRTERSSTRSPKDNDVGTLTRNLWPMSPFQPKAKKRRRKVATTTTISPSLGRSPEASRASVPESDQDEGPDEIRLRARLPLLMTTDVSISIGWSETRTRLAGSRTC